MTAATLNLSNALETSAIRTSTEMSNALDIYTADEMAILEARWEAAGRDLDEARRHVEIAAGLLYPLLPVELIEAFASRWIRDAHGELERLDLIGELPRGAR